MSQRSTRRPANDAPAQVLELRQSVDLALFHARRAMLSWYVPGPKGCGVIEQGAPRQLGPNAAPPDASEAAVVPPGRGSPT